MRYTSVSIAVLLIYSTIFISCGVPENADWSGGDRGPDKLQDVLWTENQVFLPFSRVLVIESSKSLVFFSLTNIYQKNAESRSKHFRSPGLAPNGVIPEKSPGPLFGNHNSRSAGGDFS